MSDSILYWNGVALDANRESHVNDKKEQTGPILSARALAIVHLAMYDAYVAVAKPAGLAPCLPGLPPAPAGATAAAAVAGAAHATLSALYPSQKMVLDKKLADAGVAAGDTGLPFGRQIASAILEDRKNDP